MQADLASLAQWRGGCGSGGDVRIRDCGTIAALIALLAAVCCQAFRVPLLHATRLCGELEGSLVLSHAE